MKFGWIPVVVGLLAFGASTPALAEDEADVAVEEIEVPSGEEVAPPQPEARIEKLCSRVVMEDVTMPATAGGRCCCVPLCDSVTVPCYEYRRTPVYRTVTVPVYETKEEPVYATKRTPRYKEVEVPVFTVNRIPITRQVCDPCTGCITTVTCGYRCEQVQSGTRKDKVLDGCDTEQVPCGTRHVRVQTATRTEQVLCGYRCDRVQTGTRTYSCHRGYGWRWVGGQATGTRTEKREVCVPAHDVTVVPGDDKTGVEPLPGTNEVYTEAEFKELMNACRDCTACGPYNAPCAAPVPCAR